MKNTYRLKVLSVIMTLVMLIMAIPVGVFALDEGESVLETLPEEEVSIQNTYDEFEDMSEPAEESEAYVLGEMEELRESDSKQFRMSDGSYTTVSYTSDVHYEADGAWKEIDNTLLPKEEGIVNTASDIQYTFTADTDSLPGVTAVSGDYQVSFSGVPEEERATVSDDLQPAAEEAVVIADTTADTETEDEPNDIAQDIAPAENATESAEADVEPTLPEFELEILNPQTEIAADLQETEDKYPTLGEAAAVDTVASAVKYNEVTGGDSYVYELQGRDLKESVIINTPREDYTYHFELNLAGLTAVLTESGDISLCDGENEIFVMPAPYMLDADGAYSDAAAYTLSELPEGGYALTLTADAAWINAAERAFPVIIDPSIYVTNPSSSGTKITAECIYVGSDGVSHDFNDTYFKVGREGNTKYYSYLKVNSLPIIPYNARFCKAWIGLQGISYYAASSTNFSAFDFYAQEALGNWKSQFTGTKNSNQLVDYITMKKSALYSPVEFEVTRQAEKWYSDASTNNGIVLFAKQTDGNELDENCQVWMHIPRYQSDNGKVAMPYFAVNYQNIQGLESYYSYQNFSAGRAGAAYVSAYTGALTLVHTDVSDAYTLSHVYNSNYAGCIFSLSETDSGNNPIFHTVNYDSMVIGKGWKLSAQESVVTQAFTNYDGTQGEYAIYTDGDGTEHYFHSAAANQFKDEDGLGLTLSRSGNNFTMTDDKGNIKFFVYGYLTYIKDSNGNITAFVYNNKTFQEGSTAWYPSASGNKLTKIVQKNDGKDAYTVATLGYSGNRLISITDRYGKVTNCGSSTTSYQLNEVTEPDGTTLYYYYGGGDLKMSGAYDGESKAGLLFTYLSGKAYVNKVTVYAKNSASENVTNRIYYFNLGTKGYTKVRDCGRDNSTSTPDDVIGHYVLDNYGRTVSYAVTNQYGNTLSAFGGTYQPHETGKETSKKNNRLLSEGSSGAVAQNKLRNGDGESLVEWGMPYTVSGYYSTGRNSKAKKSGKYSISVNLEKPLQSASASQTVNILTEGYYNVTAYVKSSYLNTTDTKMSGAYLDVKGSNYDIVRQDILKETTDTAVNDGWRMLTTIVHIKQKGDYTCHLKLDQCRGTVYFDEIRLTDGRDGSAFNLIENGNFDYGLDGASSTVGASIINVKNRNGAWSDALNMTGDPQTQSLYSKRVDITLPAAEAQNTTFLLSGWAYARSLPITQDDRTFQLSAQIHYADGDYQYVSARFNADVASEWQYVCTPVVPNKNKAITGITVHCSFKKNSGFAYFDDLALTMEPCATYRYNDDGKLTAVNSTNHDEMQYQYSGADLLSSSGGAGGDYSYTYDSAHNITKAANEGLSQTMTYDAAGLMTSTTLKGDGAAPYLKTSATYTADGSKLLSVTDALGNTSSYQYSSGGKLTSVTSPESSTIDPLGETGTVTTNTMVDDAGRPWRTYINGVASVGYTYSGGNLSSVSRGGYISGVTDKQTQKYSFTYDLFGNCLDTKVGDRTLITNTYDDKYTTLTRSTYGNNYIIDYEYDELERLTSKDELYWKEEYAYDKNGKISWMKASSNVYNDVVRTTTYEYDTLGRLIYSLEVDESGKTLRYVKNKYNNKNQLTECTFYDGKQIQTQSYTYKADGSIDTFNVTNGDKITNTYDSLKRISQKTIDHDSNASYKCTVKTEYVNRGSENQTTGLVESVRYGYKNNDNSFTSGSRVRDYKYMYEYDNIGNITRAYYRTAGSDGHYTDHEVGRYFYDEQNQLVMEKVYDGDYTLLYEYDTYGNIREVRKYDSTDFDYPGEAFSYGTPVSTETYGYNDDTWKDLLTSYNGYLFKYDKIGNPTKYQNSEKYYDMSWNGRILRGAWMGADYCIFDYDSSGQRVSKTTKDGEYTYLYYGTKLMQYGKEGEYDLYFFYDDNDQPLGFYYTDVFTSDTGDKYYFVLNAQGDVVQIRDKTNDAVANYHYDAWGKLLSITDADGDAITNKLSIALKNPIRYRGYVYDNETGFYYLNTRYYDPSLRRFINADGYVSTGQGISGFNMFAYCGNNPVNRVDSTGMGWKDVGKFFSNAWNGIKNTAKKIFGIESSTEVTITDDEISIVSEPAPITIKTGTTITQTVSKYGDSSKPISLYVNKDAEHPIKSSSAGIDINIYDSTLNLCLGLDNIGISGSLTNENVTNSFGVKLNLSELQIGFENSTSVQLDNKTQTTYTNYSLNGWSFLILGVFIVTGEQMPSPSYAYSH